MNWKLTAVIALATAALTACGTEIGDCSGAAIRQGISVDVDPAYAPKVGSARLSACWNGSCQHSALEFYPSTAGKSSSCPSGGPDTACAARMAPTGGLHSFADLRELPAGPVEVTLTLIDPAGAGLGAHQVVVTPKVRYPAGPECGGGTPQGGLFVSPDGTVSERQ
ncbi:hypothetical protein [Kibdelosporangium persicum]|uniref:hypothetical protein n=1 Tax=Kibdelosporangium persicum TaxID=2698649 RepID=UPI0015675408|nr:hypothetical protein [Kibdelosporangium persicum]